jgi:hypothetical protein
MCRVVPFKRRAGTSLLVFKKTDSDVVATVYFDACMHAAPNAVHAHCNK